MRDKRKRKLDRHYYILVDGRKCRILNYKIEKIQNFLLEGNTLTLITKFREQDFSVSRDTGGVICIENDSERLVFRVKPFSASWSSTVWKFHYWIIDQRVEPKTVRQTSETPAIEDTAATAREME